MNEMGRDAVLSGRRTVGQSVGRLVGRVWLCTYVVCGCVCGRVWWSCACVVAREFKEVVWWICGGSVDVWWMYGCMDVDVWMLDVWMCGFLLWREERLIINNT